jgi:hypothetical protein
MDAWRLQKLMGHASTANTTKYEPAELLATFTGEDVAACRRVLGADGDIEHCPSSPFVNVE